MYNNLSVYHRLWSGQEIEIRMAARLMNVLRPTWLHLFRGFYDATARRATEACCMAIPREG